MTNSFLTKPNKTQRTRLVFQLENIQEDLMRLSGYISELSDLPNEQLEALDLSDQLTSIRRSLKCFETHLAAIKIGLTNGEFADPVMEESDWVFPMSTVDWNPVRREAKHANKLARQLTESISKIRVDLSENQYPAAIPEDLLRINQTIGYVVNDFVTDDLPIHG